MGQKKTPKKNDKYLLKLLNEYPDIASGRKNYDLHEKRIQKSLEVIKNFKKKLKIKNC